MGPAARSETTNKAMDFMTAAPLLGMRVVRAVLTGETCRIEFEQIPSQT